MKLKKVTGLILFGFFCMLFGIFLYGAFDSYYRKDMIHVHLDTKQYELDLFLKDRDDILRINTFNEVIALVDIGMGEIMIDIMAPHGVKEVFIEIGKEKLKEKRKLLEDLLQFMEEDKKKGSEIKI